MGNVVTSTCVIDHQEGGCNETVDSGAYKGTMSWITTTELFYDVANTHDRAYHNQKKTEQNLQIGSTYQNKSSTKGFITFFAIKANAVMDHNKKDLSITTTFGWPPSSKAPF